MLNSISRCALVSLAILFGACATDDDAKSPSEFVVGRTTYDQATKTLRRPPTSARTVPGGDLVATWITQTQGGERHLVLTFGPDRVLKNQYQQVQSR